MYPVPPFHIRKFLYFKFSIDPLVSIKVLTLSFFFLKKEFYFIGQIYTQEIYGQDGFKGGGGKSFFCRVSFFSFRTCYFAIECRQIQVMFEECSEHKNLATICILKRHCASVQLGDVYNYIHKVLLVELIFECLEIKERKTFFKVKVFFLK